ncbi:phage antirepressor protein [Candidatus Pacearchaeota archaeon]|nr:phage antirepressor protein [Candidatus Pacearchaeota archaeon]
MREWGDEMSIIVFNNKRIRRKLVNGEWFYSVVDIVAILTEQNDFQMSRKYWNKLAERLRKEGSEVVTFCHRLKLLAEDGKFRETDCANKETIFRIIQSIPSKKAEPFKLWLAKVGSERIDEIENPELAQERMKEIYDKKGYSKQWIDKRLRGIAIRQNLTDEWKERGVEGQSDFAILTAEISKASFGMTPNEYKKFKGLKNENLRDHMTDLELIFNMLGEASTSEIEKVQNPQEFCEHILVSRKGGEIAKNAREELEQETGESILSEENYLTEKEKTAREKRKKKILVEMNENVGGR